MVIQEILRVLKLDLFLSTTFPATIFLVRKYADRDAFQKFNACTACDKLYSFDDSHTVDKNGVKKSKLQFYMISLINSRKKLSKDCGNKLLKSVILNGKLLIQVCNDLKADNLRNLVMNLTI